MHDDPILDAFSRRLHTTPDEAIVVDAAGVTTVADVARMARAMGQHLVNAGARAGALVGLALANGPAFLAGLLAVRRTGAAALLLDVSMPATARQVTARALGCRLLLTARGEQALAMVAVEMDGVEASLEEALSEEALSAEGLGADVAVVKLTSGSTGQPRGIVTPSAALVADDAALATTMGLRDDERILAAIPFSHSYGLSSVVMPALMRHATLVVPATGDPLDPMRMARAHDVTFMPTVPAYLQALVRRATPPRRPSCLRLVVTAGAPLAPTTAARFRACYGLPVHVFYGASECGGITYDRTGGAGERGTLGTPVDGVAVDLEAVAEDRMGAEDCTDAQDGGRGRVVVRSAAVARGYWPPVDPTVDPPVDPTVTLDVDADLTRGCFRTRDLVTWRNGELALEGRLDTLINVRGKKVNPREIETALSRMPGVEEVVAVGVEVGDEPLLRVFVAGALDVLSYQQVQAWCRGQLAGHKVPRSIVLLETIPRSPRGKVDYRALSEHVPRGKRGQMDATHDRSDP